MIMLMKFPALEKIPRKIAETFTQLRALRIAIAVEQYRRDHEERLPGELAELIPDYLSEIPVDPFSGEDMKFLANDQEYIV
jgi:hypothetical protein